MRLFKHEPDRTATGYLLLDWITAPYWWLMDKWAQRQFWKLFRIKDESLQETKNWVRERLSDRGGE